MEVLFAIAYIVIVIAAIIINKKKKEAQKNKGVSPVNQKPYATRSDDGHRIPRAQDLTCEKQYGHKHTTIDGTAPRYIVHEEPEQGYVILNGVKRRIKDLKDF